MEHETTTIVLALFNLILGSLFLLVGFQNGRRKITSDEYLPLLAFALWWYSAGAALVLTGLVEVLDVVWRPDLAMHVTENILTLFFGCFALFCLSIYFGFLYLGSNRLWIPLAAFYGLSLASLIYLIQFQRPIGIELASGTTHLVFENELPSFGVVLRLLILLVVPPVLGLFGYLLLYKRAPRPLQRYRILITSIVILSLFTNVIIVRLLNLHLLPSVHFTLRIIAIAASGFLLLTYWTPAALARKWGVRTF